MEDQHTIQIERVNVAHKWLGLSRLPARLCSLLLVDEGWTVMLVGHFLTSFTFCEDKLVALFRLKIALYEFSSCLERTFLSTFLAWILS